MPNKDNSREASEMVFPNNRIDERHKDFASEVLTDKTQFVLSPQKWDEFCAALDAEPKTIPALKELFNKPDVFKEQ